MNIWDVPGPPQLWGLSGYEVIKCTKKWAKDETNEEKWSFGKSNNSFHYSLEELLSWGGSSRCGLNNRQKFGQHQEIGVFVGDTSLRWVWIWKPSAVPWPGSQWGTQDLQLPLQPQADPHLAMDLPGHWECAWRSGWWPEFHLHAGSVCLVQGVGSCHRLEKWQKIINISFIRY